MKDEELSQLLAQHVNTYRRAVLDTIRNNTDVLVEQDILSLLKKPPLDSMDMIRSKFLDLAKKNKIVLNIDALDVLLGNYRDYLIGYCNEIREIRASELSSIIEKEKVTKSTDTFKINKKDFVAINKRIKNLLKEKLTCAYSTYILEKIEIVFSDTIDDAIQNKIKEELSKYVKGSYQKQLLENFELKIMVKDTILMNAVKEQAEHYLFVLNNSHLLNEIDS